MNSTKKFNESGAQLLGSCNDWDRSYSGEHTGLTAPMQEDSANGAGAEDGGAGRPRPGGLTLKPLPDKDKQR